MGADVDLTMEEIQGRLNQREIPWKAEPTEDGAAVKFVPSDGRAVYVFWDRGHGSAPRFDQIVDFLASGPR